MALSSFDKVFGSFSPARNFCIRSFLQLRNKDTKCGIQKQTNKQKTSIPKHPDFSLRRKVLPSRQFHDKFRCSPVVAGYCTPVWHQLQVPKITYLLSSLLLVYIQGSLVHSHKEDPPKGITAGCLPVKNQNNNNN